jgi:hypothetical protein
MTDKNESDTVHERRLRQPLRKQGAQDLYSESSGRSVLFAKINTVRTNSVTKKPAEISVSITSISVVSYFS